MQYLHFDLGEGDDGVTTLEAMAAGRGAEGSDIRAEAQAVLDWAWRAFPGVHGPAEDGGTWDHDLQVVDEPGGWQTITLSLTGSPAFVDAFSREYPQADD